MFTTLPQKVQIELTSIAERFGQPRVHFAELAVPRLFNPLNSADRYGEVCMVVRRPNGQLITATKNFYPKDAYRLLTGGLNHGEQVLDGLLRETQEETGLEVIVTRFLAAVAYHLPSEQAQPMFYTFAFLLDEIGGVLGCLDEHEQVAYFREIAPDDLRERAEFFMQLAPGHSPYWDGDWADWGKFRAVIHHQVWQALHS